MDYPKLKQSLEKEIATLEKGIDSTRAKLERALSLSGLHQERLDTRSESAEQLRMMLGELEKERGLLAITLIHLNEESAQASDEFTAPIDSLSKRIASIDEKINPLRAKHEKAQAIAQKHRGNKDRQAEAALALESRLRELNAQKATLEGDLSGVQALNPVTEQLEDPEFVANFERTQAPARWPNSRWDIFLKLYGPRAESGKCLHFSPKPNGRFAALRKQDIPVDHCPVDPNQFSEGTLEELGLGAFPMGLNEAGRLRLKIAATPHMRRLFNNAEPLTRIDQAERPVPNHRLLVVQNFSTEQDGKILHTFHHGGDEDRKVLQVYDNAYTLYRKTLHVDRRYGGESKVIIDSERRIHDLHQRFLAIRKGDADETAQKDAVRQALAHEAELLLRCRNRFKASARDALASIADLKDRLGRENVGAARARLLTVIKFVKSRSPEIFSKSKFTQEDKQYMKDLVDRSETLFEGHSEKLSEILTRLSRAPSHDQNPDRQAQYIQTTLLEPLGGVTVRPFSLYSGHLRAQLTLMIDQIRANDREGLRYSAKKSLAILQIFKVQKHIERLIQGVSGVDEPNFQSLAKRVAPLLQWIVELAQNPSAENPLSAYPGALKSMADTIGKCSELLRLCLEKPMDAAECEKARGSLKVALEALDFPNILHSL